MHTFRHYGKIHRLGKEEVADILVGKCHIQEKIDGANTSIWLGAEGEVRMGSRNNDVTGGGFNGFCDYVKSHEGINAYFKDFPTHRLYGEWLVRHTISYKETAYKKFYLFDIYNHDTGEYYSHDQVKEVAEKYKIETVPYYGMFVNPTVEELQKFVGKTAFGDRGEGIVIKNLDFVNTFGELCYAKIVTESFKEDNGITFGGNNKHSETYAEMRIVNKFMTLPRVKKIMDKIQPLIDKPLAMEHIPRIINTAYHDMLTEEIWAIQSDVQSVNFVVLKRIATKKAKQVYVDILNNDISVADQK